MTYASAVQGFGVGNFYAGPSGIMGGGPTFSAAVLFRTMDIDPRQTLVDNLDAAAFTGWRIWIDSQAAPGNVAIGLEYGDGVGVIPVAKQLQSGPMEKLSLVHVVFDSGNGYIYLNGARVHTFVIATPAVARVGAPRIGLDSANANPANVCDILGAAYLAGVALSQVQVSKHWDSCYRANDMAQRDQVTPGAAWTNRFSARNGAVVAGAQGTVVNGDLTVPPVAADTWAPSEGAAALTKTGTLYANVLTNPVWAYGQV